MGTPGWADGWDPVPVSSDDTADEPVRWRRARLWFSLAGAWALGCGGVAAQTWTSSPTPASGATLVALAGLVALVVVHLGGARVIRWVILAAMTAVAGKVAHQTIGATPMVLTVVGVVIGHGALVRWWPWPGHRFRSVDVAALVVPVLVLAEVGWYRGRGVGFTLGLFLVALLLLEAYAQVPAVEIADGGFRRGVVRVAVGVGSAVVLLVALPLLYLPGAVVALAGRSGDRKRRRAGSWWRSRSVTIRDQRLDAGFPFASTERRDLRIQQGIGLVLAVVLVGGLVVYRRSLPPEEVAVPVNPFTGEIQQATISDPSDPTGAEPRWSELDAGRGLEWADDAQVDAKAMTYSVHPVGGMTLDDLATDSINQEDGERRTLAPAPCQCTPVKIWIVGGSAAWGAGQRDLHTISSELVREGERDGLALEVTNMAVPGWTLWQEYQGVLARLAQRPERPDLVVFYNGFNDMAGVFTQVMVGSPDFDRPSLVDSDIQQAGGLHSLDQAEIDERLEAAGGAEVIGEKAADRYERLRELVALGLASEGIAVEWFFQPDAATTDQTFRGLDNPPLGPTDELKPIRTAFDDVVEVAATQLEPEVHNLRHLFDDDPASVFLDYVHTNEVGAAQSASAIYQVIRSDLRERVG